jgi:hypothetical protein
VIREQAEIINHQLQPGDELPPDVTEDRRWTPAQDESATAAPPPRTESRSGMFDRLRRAFSRA